MATSASFPYMIITPEGTFLSGEAEELLVPSINGPLGILKGHTPYVSPLKENGKLKIVEHGQESFYFLEGGILEVKEDVVLILALRVRKDFSDVDSKTMNVKISEGA